MNTKETVNKNSILDDDKLCDVKQYKDTPFDIVKVEDNYFIALGKYRLTELIPDKDVLSRMIDEHSWDLILAVVGASHIKSDNNNTKN